MSRALPRTLLARAALRPSTTAVARPALPLPLLRPQPHHLSLRFFHNTFPSRATSSQQAYSTPGSACPKCGATLPPALAPVCPACSHLLPPPLPTTTYYELFSIEPTYDIDAKALKRKFLQLQQKVHPDMFSGKGEVEDWAKTWSGRVNDAYKALVNDRDRGEYLLSLHDVTIGEGDPMTDSELLMNIMETREALEEASTEEEVAEIRRQNADATKDAISQLSTALSSSPPDLEKARNLVIELNYFANIDTSALLRSVNLVLPGELSKHAISEGTKAVTKFSSTK